MLVRSLALMLLLLLMTHLKFSKMISIFEIIHFNCQLYNVMLVFSLTIVIDDTFGFLILGNFSAIFFFTNATFSKHQNFKLCLVLCICIFVTQMNADLTIFMSFHVLVIDHHMQNRKKI